MKLLKIHLTSSCGSDINIRKNNESKYVVTLFGRDEKGISHAIEIHNFLPYLFVSIQNNNADEEIHNIISHGKKRHNSHNNIYISLHEQRKRLIESASRIGIVSWKVVKRHKFRGFEGGKRFRFLRIEFQNVSSYRRVIYNRYETRIDGNTYPRKGSPSLFESDIDPLVRLFDIQGVEPANWIQIENAKSNFITTQNAQDGIKTWHTDYKMIHGISDPNEFMLPIYGPLKTMYIDIECGSSHGDFPLAKKTYMKTSRDIINAIGLLTSYSKSDVMVIIKKILLSALDPTNKRDRVYLKCDDPDGITSCIDGPTLIESKVGLNIIDMINNLLSPPSEKTLWVKHVRGWDRSLLASRIDSIIYNMISHGVHGDPVIQIGVALKTIGMKTCSMKKVFVLGGCERIHDIDIVVCKTESELLTKFASLIRSEDPDIITGYNIVPFDIPYLYDRACECGDDIRDNFTNIGRIKRDHINEGKYMPCKHLFPIEKLKLQILSSSSMGNNTNRRLNIIGRNQIDQLKYVRESEKLDSYKLENVAGVYLYGNIFKIESIGTQNARIYTNDIRGVSKGDFVIFTFMFGAQRENMIFISSIKNTIDEMFKTGKSDKINTSNICKIKLVSVKHDKIGTSGSFVINIEQNWMINLRKCDKWNQAKDDVPPEEIFRLQKGDNKDRSKLAHYCMQDVLLTVELMEKACILENVLAFANICRVPVYWITDRGQGGRIQAFVASICRKREYLMPKLYKYDPRKNQSSLTRGITPRTNGELHAEAVKGAVVLEENPGVYDVPVVVVDYTSLYPSVMTACSMSHETLAYRDCDIYKTDGSNRKRLEKEGYIVYDIK